jgi:uncharacterized protein DUF4160
MPTVIRFSRCRIAMYFDDHPPPHFHVIAGDEEGKFRIDTLECWAGEVDPREVREALEWAGENRELLYALWVKYSEEEES